MTLPNADDLRGEQGDFKSPLAGSQHSEIKSITIVCRHKSGPEGYIQRSGWLERMSKRYRQEQCTKCGLWAIWRKK